MSNRPGFIVDGFTEKLILQKLCPGSKISRLDLNGKNVSAAAMAKKIASLVRLNGGRYYPIVVLVDKENRDVSFQEFREEIRQELEPHHLEGEDIRIGVVDRMIENWLIADWNCLDCDGERPDLVDGINGSAELKKYFGNFGKTTDVVDLFLLCSCETMRRYSSSFSEFFNSIADLDCHFFKS